MATKKEKEEMTKALSGIDNKFDMVAYIWTYRGKEIKNYIIMFLLAIIIGLLLKFTPLLDIIFRFIERLLGI